MSRRRRDTASPLPRPYGIDDEPLPQTHDNPLIARVAPQAVEVAEEHLIFPGGVMLPLSLRASGGPGAPGSPWQDLSAADFLSASPSIYSVALQRLAPEVLRSSLRVRRTLFEGALLALAEKTGRRPSQAEQAVDHALDSAESQVALGKPAFRSVLLAAYYAARDRVHQAQSAIRTLEGGLRGRGFAPQRLYYIPERALLHLQPGGDLFPGLDESTLLLEDAARLLPAPSRRIRLPDAAVLLGSHAEQSGDIYFSFSEGFDPDAPRPPHALSLICGEMGSGKTSLMRLILTQRLLQGRTIVTLDPEGENSRLCRAMGGRVIPAGAPEDKRFCLLHPLQAGSPAEMLLGARFFLAALAGEEALTPGVQAALHAAVKRRWERQVEELGERDRQVFSISALVDSLGALGAAEAALPLALLGPFARGGLWEGFFDRPQVLLEVDLPAETWWNFDLSGLREENKAIVHAVLAWFLYQAVTLGRQAMDVYIDEGWRLLRSRAFAGLLDELGRRARKRGIGVMLITHLPDDLRGESTSLSLASNAFIGRMGPEQSFAFFRSLGVPQAEAEARAEQAGRLPPRTFLAAPAGGRGPLFPLTVGIPPGWLEFWRRCGAAQ